MFLKSTKLFLLINLGLLVVLTIFLLFPSSTLAAIKLAIPIGGKTTVADLGDYLATFYKYFIGIVGILATVMIMFGGFRWITAAGSPDKIKEAKSNIMSAIIAVVLMLCSYLILRLINPALIDMTVPYIDTIQTVKQETGVPICDEKLKIECGKTKTDKNTTCQGNICPSGQKCILEKESEKSPPCFKLEDACKKVSNPSSQADCDPYSDLNNGKICNYSYSTDANAGFCFFREFLKCPSPSKRIGCQQGGSLCWDDRPGRNQPNFCPFSGGKILKCVDESEAPYPNKGEYSICCEEKVGATPVYSCYGGI